MDIDVREITKIYKVFDKKEGLRASALSLFHREMREIPALRGISFHIDGGEIVGFVGKNGSGKTTTMKILAGLLSPTAGSVRIDGWTPFDKDYEFLKRLGFITGQKGQLRPDLPAADSFDLLISIYELERTEAKKKVRDLAGELTVEHVLSQPVRLLSLGQRMKCELIASLLHGPSLLLLDEPTLGLDFASAESIRRIIYKEAKEKGTTVILSSHILDDIQEICGRMILIDAGKVKFDGSLDACFRAYAKHKILTVRTKKDQLEPAKRIAPDAVCGVGDNTVSWEIPREEMPHMVERIMRQIGVEDITVKEPSLGKVIERIAAGKD